MTNTNGAVATIDIDELDIDQAITTADELPSPTITFDHIRKAIEALAPIADGLDAGQRVKLLDVVKPLAGEIPTEDRALLEGALHKFFKTGKEVDSWLAALPAKAAGPVFTPYSFDDLLAMPPKQWLIDGVIGAGDMGMVYGAPGCGKTFVIIDLALSACIGKQWAMRFDVANPLNVAYCAGEGISGLPSRFKAAAHHHGIDTISNFTFYKTIPQLFTEGDSVTTVTIKQFVTEWQQRQSEGQAQPLDLLIIDTLHTASTAADENSAKDMGKVLHLCRWAGAELGCAVVLIHHTSKNGNAERGSSSLRGAMDFMIEIKRESDTSTKAKMHCSKLKDGEQWKDQALDLVSIDGLDSVRIWWDEPTDGEKPNGKKATDKAAILAELKRYAGSKFNVKRLAEVIAQSDTYARNLVSELEKSGEVKRELSDPSKEPSSRNSWVYFVESTQYVGTGL